MSCSTTIHPHSAVASVAVCSATCHPESAVASVQDSEQSNFKAPDSPKGFQLDVRAALQLFEK
eukprot:1144437-Pelagomonas_calceolata.AAC.5